MINFLLNFRKLFVIEILTFHNLQIKEIKQSIESEQTKQRSRERKRRGNKRRKEKKREMK
jgi:hypothetical protein